MKEKKAIGTSQHGFTRDNPVAFSDEMTAFVKEGRAIHPEFLPQSTLSLQTNYRHLDGMDCKECKYCLDYRSQRIAEKNTISLELLCI